MRNGIRSGNAAVRTHWARAALAVIFLALSPLLSGCATTGVGAPSAPEQRLTPGLVQRDVRAGMAASDVAAALGSPNIVTRDADGRDVWVYDRISSDVVETRLSAWVAGAGPVGAGAMAGGGSGSERRTVTVQRTLTVVVRFDEAARVANVRFHASRF